MPEQPKPQGCDRCGSLERRQSVADLAGNRHLFCHKCLFKWSEVRRKVVDDALLEFAAQQVPAPPSLIETVRQAPALEAAPEE